MAYELFHLQRLRVSDWHNITSANDNPLGTVTGSLGALSGATYFADSDLVETVRFRTVANSGVASLPTEAVTILLDKEAPADTALCGRKRRHAQSLPIPTPGMTVTISFLPLRKTTGGLRFTPNIP
jgi:hypothetical protein